MTQRSLVRFGVNILFNLAITLPAAFVFDAPTWAAWSLGFLLAAILATQSWTVLLFELLVAKEAKP